MEHRFDLLTKAVAEGGTSRREALRRLGGGLVSALLVSFGLRDAWSQGTSDCAHFCIEAFPPGPARAQCIAEGAQGTGLCAECGADLDRLCLDPGGNQFCCPDGLTCCDGKCVDLENDLDNCGFCGNVCPGPACFSSDPNDPNANTDFACFDPTCKRRGDALQATCGYNSCNNCKLNFDPPRVCVAGDCV